VSEEEECKHGLDPATCSLCLHGPERKVVPTIEVTMMSRYEGQCPSCDLPIHIGQVIHGLSNGSYVHAGCE
jgi:hypothetical protein